MLSTKMASQPKALSILKGYLRKKHLPHALLFSGPDESGQKETALKLALVLFCEKPLWEFESCGECAQCRLLLQGSHPDYKVLEPEEDTHVIKVDLIRELIAQSNLRPFQACKKIFVIDRAECMNEITQNALLKTLEEPSASTHLVLISYASEKLLSTIRSRTQQIIFLPLRSDIAPDPKVEAIRYEMLAYMAGEGPWKTAETAAMERSAVMNLLDLLCADLRDILVLGAGAGNILGFTNDLPLKERALAKMSEEILFKRIGILSEFKEKISESANMKLTLSVLRDELAPTEPWRA